MKNQSSVGMTQSFRLIRFKDAQGLDAEDLLEQTPDGTQIRPSMLDKVVEDRAHRNKWTRRGLSRVMWATLYGHGNNNYYPLQTPHRGTGDWPLRH